MIKLIAADLDGTLLNSRRELPEGFFELVRRLRKKGVLFAAASGRQFYSVQNLFYPIRDEMLFIAENGAYILDRDKPVYTLALDRKGISEMVGRANELNSQGVRTLLSGAGGAYLLREDDPWFAEKCEQYCLRINFVDSFDDIPETEEIFKIAIYDPEAEHRTYPHMQPFGEDYSVILSGSKWVDIVRKEVNKGDALIRLMEHVGATPDETACFGDYLNDLEMMGVCTHSFAMENGHAELKAAASEIVPSNDDNGVVKTILRIVPGLDEENN